MVLNINILHWEKAVHKVPMDVQPITMGVQMSTMYQVMPSGGLQKVKSPAAPMLSDRRTAEAASRVYAGCQGWTDKCELEDVGSDR